MDMTIARSYLIIDRGKELCQLCVIRFIITPSSPTKVFTNKSHARLTYSGIRIDNGLYVVQPSQRPYYNRLITIL